MTNQHFQTAREVKGYLSQGFTVQKEINRLQERINELEAMTVNSSSVLTMGAGGRATDSLGDNVARMVDLQKDYSQLLGEKIDLEQAIKDLIYSLGDDRYRGVLMERYINLLTWEEVAVTCGYTYKHVHRIHGWALQSLAEKMT